MARRRASRSARPGHLPHAPIMEALIDLRVDLPPGVDLERIAQVGEALQEEYPTRRSRVMLAGSFSFTGDDSAPSTQANQKVDGYAFESRDKQRVVQLSQGGFTFSWLRPYDTWERLRDEAKARWVEYRAKLKPVAVTRVGLRYLNRMELPLPVQDLRDWVLSGPQLAPGLPTSLVGLFSQLAVPLPEARSMVTITETFDAPGDRKDVLPLVLDIDVGTVDLRFEPDSKAIWRLLEKLRHVKNDFFFKSITPRTRSLFE
jgi:uncharacterized protein (TIGR04255 family)